MRTEGSITYSRIAVLEEQHEHCEHDRAELRGQIGALKAQVHELILASARVQGGIRVLQVMSAVATSSVVVAAVKYLLSLAGH
jgi:hypothetical protein